SPEGDFVLVQDDGTQINCRTNDGLFCSEVRAGHLVVLDGKLDAGGVVVITQWHLGRKRTRRSVTV
ncbi:MAG: hypothetical protein PF961_06910, partial [Planctomycetota bacterium]|nr:hypothetical protein [Planctomycetota bacterium]